MNPAPLADTLVVMVDMLPLPHWTALASLDDDAVPLMSTALLIARDEYPQLDAELYDTLVQSHVEHLRREVDAIDLWPLKMAAVNRYLFDELGYSGNHDEYYDPRNSYLNEVFERRLGNPISLAMVQIEVARRLGIPLAGVSFPGHFLVRLPVDDGVLVMDPFNGGRPLGVDELRERARPHLGGEIPDDRALAIVVLNFFLIRAAPGDPDPHPAQPVWRLRRCRALGPRRPQRRPHSQAGAGPARSAARSRHGVSAPRAPQRRPPRPGALPAAAPQRAGRRKPA